MRAIHFTCFIIVQKNRVTPDWPQADIHLNRNEGVALHQRERDFFKNI